MLTALLVVPQPTLASGGGTDAVDDAYVDRMLYATSMSTFIAATKGRTGPDGRSGDGWFDWTTDYCSAPLVGNTGRSFDFTNACRRHDFGYRNTHLLDKRYGKGTYWNSTSRKQIDQQFLADMKAHCSARNWYDKPTCTAWAYTFYNAVRIAGGP
ncbi:MAG TPA: phospholipase A2 [Ilumatobacteraceae bacterium]|nr:phospholipase A2 [Ilumatobacteraceae bacterium]